MTRGPPAAVVRFPPLSIVTCVSVVELIVTRAADHLDVVVSDAEAGKISHGDRTNIRPNVHINRIIVVWLGHRIYERGMIGLVGEQIGLHGNALVGREN